VKYEYALFHDNEQLDLVFDSVEQIEWYLKHDAYFSREQYKIMRREIGDWTDLDS
jgi:hypothetical protein